jgi:hypothetical protein
MLGKIMLTNPMR